MSILEFILRDRKPAIHRQFVALGRQPVPDVDLPASPEDALALGYRMGLQAGYGKGLADGVGLGIDVGTYSSAHANTVSFHEPMDVN